MQILDFIFPKRCVGCGITGKYFCDKCRPGIRSITSNEAICPVCEKSAIDGATHPRCRTRYTIDGLTSFFRYDGIVKKAVKAIKYRFVYNLASEFVSLIPPVFLTTHYPLRTTPRILIPVPLHHARLRFRGFNQAEKLGALLAKQLHIPLRTDIIYRTKNTVPQVETKDRKERLRNMEDVFCINHDATTRGRIDAVLLFDDVFTTGATMRAAAGILKRHGVQSVWGVTMAR